MKKAIVFLFVIIGFSFASCQNNVVTYCPFCSKANVKEISKYDKDTGLTKIYYECTNPKCGKKFGAGTF
jgi:transposase-like protein